MKRNIEDDLDPLAQVVGRRSDESLFRDFDRKHPNIWILFEEMALSLIEKGFKKYSPDCLLHGLKMAWDVEHGVKGKPIVIAEAGTHWVPWPKLNDHYVGFYAAKFVEAHPELDYFFPRKGKK